MSEPREQAHQEPEAAEPGRCTRAQAVLGISLMLATLYVLSGGPVIILSERANVGRTPVRIFYAPLVWLHKHTPLKTPLEWYAKLFDPD